MVRWWIGVVCLPCPGEGTALQGCRLACRGPLATGLETSSGDSLSVPWHLSGRVALCCLHPAALLWLAGGGGAPAGGSVAGWG